MFVKINRREKGGKTYYYAELVESYREEGKVKHRRLLYFGSVDFDTAQRLKIAFSRDFDSFTNIDKVDFASAVPYGSYYLIDKLCSRLGLFDLFRNSFTSSDKHISVNTAVDYIKALVYQRIMRPESKLAMVESFSSTPLKHFLGLQEFELQSLYRSLEVLEENFHLVEQHLFQQATQRFNQKNKELFYDLTSSYFEGHRCIIAEFGFSRDKRRDRQQIVIGLVTTFDGFPIKCNIYPGNTVDKTTVVDVVNELKNNYPIEEVVFVGDRGMLTANNIKTIEGLGQKYVMAIPREWSKKYLKEVDISESAMREIKENLFAVFIPGYEKRLLLCLNTQKREDDQNFRQQSLATIKEELDKLNANLDKNRFIKTRDDAMKKAGAITKKNFTGKYFVIETVDSNATKLGFELRYKLKEKRLANDARLDGTFLIQTNEKEYSDEKLLTIYKNLNKVENAFRVIKNDLDIRPMYHRKESRVKGHVYTCVIACFILTAIEYRAKKAGIDQSARKILKKLSELSLIDMRLPDGKRKYSLTTTDDKQKEILKTFKINKVEMPDVV